VAGAATKAASAGADRLHTALHTPATSPRAVLMLLEVLLSWVCNPPLNHLLQLQVMPSQANKRRC
jgi:hypothetical protein